MEFLSRFPRTKFGGSLIVARSDRRNTSHRSPVPSVDYARYVPTVQGLAEPRLPIIVTVRICNECNRDPVSKSKAVVVIGPMIDQRSDRNAVMSSRASLPSNRRNGHASSSPSRKHRAGNVLFSLNAPIRTRLHRGWTRCGTKVCDIRMYL